MSIVAKNIISSQYAPSSDTVLYTAAANTHVIIDKFIACNSDSGAQTLSINIIPSGGSVGASNLIMKTFSIAAGTTKDFTELQNNILNPGDAISVIASIASKISITASAREVT